MSWTKKDYDEALNRRAVGNGGDDDERLIGLYEQEHTREPEQAQDAPEPEQSAPDGDVPMQFTSSATAEVIPGEPVDEPNADEQDNDTAGKPARVARGKSAQ